MPPQTDEVLVRFTGTFIVLPAVTVPPVTDNAGLTIGFEPIIMVALFTALVIALPFSSYILCAVKFSADVPEAASNALKVKVISVPLEAKGLEPLKVNLI